MADKQHQTKQQTTMNTTDKNIGRNMKHAMEFISRCNGWQTYSKTSRATRNAVQRLQRRGLVEVNTFFQFKKVS